MLECPTRTVHPLVDGAVQDHSCKLMQRLPVAGLSTNAGPNINADRSMDADMDPGSSGLQPIDRIRLWVGLTPDQFTDLEKLALCASSAVRPGFNLK